jgi:hypothetical protein
VKLLYVIASALFCVAAPVAAPAQSLDLSLMSALCSDDYYEDTASQCDAIFAKEVFTLETILAKYGVVIIGDGDDEIIVFLFDDPEDTPVGSIQPRNEDPVSTDEKSIAEPANEQGTIATKIVTVQPPLEIGGEAADDVAMTGPTARIIPTTAESVDDRAIE